MSNCDCHIVEERAEDVELLDKRVEDVVRGSREPEPKEGNKLNIRSSSGLTFVTRGNTHLLESTKYRLKFYANVRYQ